MNKQKIQISIITLFPHFIEQYTNFGIIARAISYKLLKFKAIDLRSFGLDKRGTVDDTPYGGGVGMVLRADVVIAAIFAALLNKTKLAKNFLLHKSNQEKLNKSKNTRVILLTPSGKQFNQKHANRLSKYQHLIFVSGRYEGFDARIAKFVDEEISVGDYVLMGGELPALTITEAVLRLIPGVLGKDASSAEESFSENVLEYPQYTKPEILEIFDKKMRVPKVLLSGHHKNISQWRKEESLQLTKKRRPDLLQ